MYLVDYLPSIQLTGSRDLGTEGALDADLALRKCLSGPNPIAVGPRYFIANRAIVATGSYGEFEDTRHNGMVNI